MTDDENDVVSPAVNTSNRGEGKKVLMKESFIFAYESNGNTFE